MFTVNFIVVLHEKKGVGIDITVITNVWSTHNLFRVTERTLSNDSLDTPVPTILLEQFVSEEKLSPIIISFKAQHNSSKDRTYARIKPTHIPVSASARTQAFHAAIVR
jgi:hypothetical protein